MKKYDDYQKSIRYKYGYFSFLFLNSLLVLNYLLGLFFNLKWGATKELETMIILFVVGIFLQMPVSTKMLTFIKMMIKRATLGYF